MTDWELLGWSLLLLYYSVAYAIFVHETRSNAKKLEERVASLEKQVEALEATANTSELITD